MKQVKIPVDERTVRIRTDQLECRVEGHRWKRVSEYASDVSDKGVILAIEVARVCSRSGCRSERIDTYSLPTFETLKRRYHYTEGYQVKVGKGERLTASDWRAALFTRVMKDVLEV